MLDTKQGKTLLHLAQEHGYVTYDDINDVLPDGLNPEDLDTLFTLTGYDSRAHRTLAIDPKGNTTLTVYDVQGRRVATPLARAALSPGLHQVSFSLGGLKSGVYIYRLEAGGKTAARKMLVVR